MNGAAGLSAAQIFIIVISAFEWHFEDYGSFVVTHLFTAILVKENYVDIKYKNTL